MSIKESLAQQEEAAQRIRDQIKKREDARTEFESARLAKLNKMGSATDERIARENAMFTGKDYVAPAELEAQAPEVIEDEAEPAEDVPVAETPQDPIVRNGVTRTRAEWAVWDEAVKQYQVAPQAPPEPPIVEIPEISDEEIARAISLGDTTESTLAVRKLKESIVGQVNEQAERNRQQLRAQECYQAALKDYPDIAADKTMLNWVVAREVLLSKQEPWTKYHPTDEVLAFNNRFRSVFEELKNWQKEHQKVNNNAALVEKKKSIHTLSSVNTKLSKKEEKPLSEAEAKAAAIAEMMNKRKARMN